MKRHRKYPLVFLVLSILTVRAAHAQGTQPPPFAPREQLSPTYPDTPKGLQKCLTDILAVAKSGDRDRLAAFIKDMEIPDFAKWFNKTYGKSKGKDSAELYRMNVDYNEYKFADYLLQLTQHDGTLRTRQINGAAQSANELAILVTLKKPVDIYYASYQAEDIGMPLQGAPVGYFMFIDGKFRWANAFSSKVVQGLDESLAPAPNAAGGAPNNSAGSPDSANNSGPIKPGKNGVGYPRCVFCPTPSYTRAAEAAHIEGVVVFQVIIRPSGRATNIVFVKGLGYGLDEAAFAALQNWRFKPASGPDGKPVATLTPIEVTFRLLN